MVERLIPLCEAIARLDLSDPAAAKAELERSFPDLSALKAEVLGAAELTPKVASDDVRFGRVAKAGPATFGLSIDAVDMRGAAAEHTHPNGEVSLCFAVDGDPRFMGEPEGWVVVPPISRHVPTVTGGRMRILYFLPDGAMIWH